MEEDEEIGSFFSCFWWNFCRKEEEGLDGGVVEDEQVRCSISLAALFFHFCHVKIEIILLGGLFFDPVV